jgi:hypothetical protein
MASLRVEVVYALGDCQVVVPLQLPQGATAGQALAKSGLAARGSRLGIGGREVPPAQALHDGDRVEILRPLALDPREARRLRAKAQKR